MHRIEQNIELFKRQTEEDSGLVEVEAMAKNKSAKVFDGMAVVNALKERKKIKTCQDLG